MYFIPDGNEFNHVYITFKRSRGYQMIFWRVSLKNVYIKIIVEVYWKLKSVVRNSMYYL